MDEHHRNYGLRRAALWTLGAALPVSGVLLAYAALLPQPGQIMGPLVLGAVLALLGVFLCGLPAKGRFAPVLPLAAAVMLVALDAASAARGLMGFLNCLVGWWNQLHEDGLRLFSVENVTQGELLWFSLILMLLHCALLEWLVQLRAFWAVGLTALVWTLLPLLMGRFSALACGLLTLGVLACWMERASGGMAFRQGAWLGAAAILLLLAAGLYPNQSLEPVDTIREAAGETVHHLRYGDGALPDGDLYQAHTMLNGEEPALTVTSQYLTTMYLRGFVGSRYQNGVWEPLPGADYGGDQTGMLDWLEARGLSPETQYSAYVGAGSEEMVENRVTVENTGADRYYVYLPYSAAQPITGGETYRDEQYRSMGTWGCKSYSFVEYSGTLPAELLQPGQWLWSPETEAQTRYTQAEAVYREFVYDSYLDVDEALEPLIHQLFWEKEQDLDAPSAYEATDRVRSVLAEYAAYREHPQAVPEDREPVSWFLLESHQGNSALFASAAVLAYRDCGIPARYAEGYLVQEGQLASGQAALTDRDGHAWVEIYLDGMGWVPVDVTPGFYYDSYALQQMVETPQTIRRAAALEDDGDSRELWEQVPVTWLRENLGSVLRRTGFWICVVLLAAACLMCLVILALELRRWRRMYLIWKDRDLSDLEKSQKLCALAANTLIWAGAGDCLGWPEEQVEAVLAERLPGITMGEYVRASELMEKTAYGEEALLPHERRTLWRFVERVRRSQVGLRRRFRLRYGI